jgi:hypothetical protein
MPLLGFNGAGMGHADRGSKSSPLGGWSLKQLVTEKLIFHIFEVPYKSMFRFLAAGYERETHPGLGAPRPRNVSCELFTSEQKIPRILQISEFL